MKSLQFESSPLTIDFDRHADELLPEDAAPVASPSRSGGRKETRRVVRVPLCWPAGSLRSPAVAFLYSLPKLAH